MLPYLIIYLGIFASGVVFRGRGFILLMLFLWCVLLVFFVGTREWVGCDFGSYMNRFETYSSTPMWLSLQLGEPGFIALNYLVIWAGLDYVWLNVFVALVYFYCIYMFVSRQDNGLALLALFFPILVVQLGMSGIRQALAVAFLLLAWNSFVDQKRILTLVWIVVASLFHTSAIVFLPMVLLIGRRVSALALGTSVLVALPVVYLLLAERAEVYQTRYLDEDHESLGAVFRISITVITCLGFEWYRSKFESLYPKDFQLMRAFSLFGLGAGVLFFVSTLAAHRMNYYVMPVQLLMLSRLPFVMTSGRAGTPLLLVPFLLYATYMIVWFNFSRHANLCFSPYSSYLL